MLIKVLYRHVFIIAQLTNRNVLEMLATLT